MRILRFGEWPAGDDPASPATLTLIGDDPASPAAVTLIGDDPAIPADGSTADESGDNSTHAGVDASSLPVDPIADAMAATPDAPDAGYPEPFANLEVDAALAIPAEADLDDGF